MTGVREGEMSDYPPTTTTPVVPDTQTETEPGRRLAPDKLCPDQQGRVVRRVIRALP